MRLAFLLCGGCLLLAKAVLAIAGNILPPPTRVTPHLYVWFGPHEAPTAQNQGFRMNMAFAVGKYAVAVIETGYSEPMAREMLAHISKITKAPVKYVINTNSEPDRFLGNEYFRRQGATIITSTAESKRMAEMAGEFVQASESALALNAGDIAMPPAPDRVLESGAELDLGGVTLQLRQFGTAHTPGPLVVSLPKDRVVYAGDILYGERLPALVEGGNMKAWIEVFDQLSVFGPVKFVPGHGKPASLAAFDFSTRAYLSLLRKHMRRAVQQGMDQQDAIRTLDQSAYKHLAHYHDLARRNAGFAFLEAEAESLH